jgi:hypothetical protein
VDFVTRTARISDVLMWVSIAATLTAGVALLCLIFALGLGSEPVVLYSGATVLASLPVAIASFFVGSLLA